MVKRSIAGLSLIVLACAASASDLRAARVEKYLSKYPGSPLRGHGQEIVYCADRFGLDYRLYLGIAGAESTFGRRYPKSNHNLTGVCNGGTRFASIYDNIYRTHEIIATGKWYRKFRATKELKDLVYVYKGVPPYEPYLRTLRAIFAGVERTKVKKPSSILAWNATPYHKYSNRRVAPFDGRLAEK